MLKEEYQDDRFELKIGFAWARVSVAERFFRYIKIGDHPRDVVVEIAQLLDLFN